MITKSVRIGLVGAVAMFGTASLMAQIDSTGMNPAAQSGANYPQTPQNMNQPYTNPTAGPTSSTPATGAQLSPSTSMRDSLGAPGLTGQQMMDKKFMRSAAEGGIADIKLGELAVQKGGPEVKELAQRMIDDHNTMNKDMASVADSMGVMLPKKMNKESQAEYDKLNGLSGKEFDEEYLTYMAKVHYQDLHAFHMEASVAADPGLQSEVVKALGMMHQHLGQITTTAKNEGVTLPPRPPRPARTTASK